MRFWLPNMDLDRLVILSKMVESTMYLRVSVFSVCKQACTLICVKQLLYRFFFLHNQKSLYYYITEVKCVWFLTCRSTLMRSNAPVKRARAPRGVLFQRTYLWTSNDHDNEFRIQSTLKVSLDFHLIWTLCSMLKVH